jgi:hypothetical protein
VRGVAPAPATVFAHLDAVRIVPAILVRLVVAALAFLASERYRDSYFSASHPQDPVDSAGPSRSSYKKNPLTARVVERIAPATGPLWAVARPK